MLARPRGPQFHWNGHFFLLTPSPLRLRWAKEREASCVPSSPPLKACKPKAGLSQGRGGVFSVTWIWSYSVSLDILFYLLKLASAYVWKDVSCSDLSSRKLSLLRGGRGLHWEPPAAGSVGPSPAFQGAPGLFSVAPTSDQDRSTEASSFSTSPWPPVRAVLTAEIPVSKGGTLSELCHGLISPLSPTPSLCSPGPRHTSLLGDSLTPQTSGPLYLLHSTGNPSPQHTSVWLPHTSLLRWALTGVPFQKTTTSFPPTPVLPTACFCFCNTSNSNFYYVYCLIFSIRIKASGQGKNFA